jgi:hypothetical protein
VAGFCSKYSGDIHCPGVGRGLAQGRARVPHVVDGHSFAPEGDVNLSGRVGSCTPGLEVGIEVEVAAIVAEGGQPKGVLRARGAVTAVVCPPCLGGQSLDHQLVESGDVGEGVEVFHLDPVLPFFSGERPCNVAKGNLNGMDEGRGGAVRPGGDDGRDGVRELPVKKAKGQLAL